MRAILLGAIALYSSTILAVPISEVIDSVLAQGKLGRIGCSKAVILGKGKITEQQCKENLPVITEKCRSEIMPGLPSEISSLEQADTWADEVTTRMFVCQVSHSLGWKFILTEKGPKFIPNE